MFAAAFGDEVEVTEELCRQYVLDFDFDWAAMSLLSEAALAVYRDGERRASVRLRTRVRRVRHVVRGRFGVKVAGKVVDRAYQGYHIDVAVAYARAYRGELGMSDDAVGVLVAVFVLALHWYWRGEAE